jgi:ADP-ribose pyrophosphatase YjhB (NUDIX family)
MAASTCTDLPPARHPRVGVGVIVWRGDHLLLIRRGKEPALGQWSLPGGSQELGETLFEAAAREVREETGVIARPTGILTAVDNLVRGPEGDLLFHYTIVDVVADWLQGEPAAADDVTDARWASRSEWEALVEWRPLLDVLALAAAQRFGTR